MNFLGKSVASVALAATIFIATPAFAETYRAGNFTITLGEDSDNGRTYRGCDSKGNCINLNHGTSWRDEGYRGITWENGNYFYSISWQENAANAPMYLTVREGNKRLLREVLQPID